MTIARSQIIQLAETLFYHCVSRCVRRAFLCGVDQVSQQSFEHRRAWLIERIHLLASVFTIDVAGYAIMSNHYHLILHVNHAAAQALSDREVAERWQVLFKGSKVVDRYLAGEEGVAELAQATLAKWRAQLFDISWFMRCLNENIARRANAEDNCTGRFWEGRFKSQPLLDEKALLAAMVYVDLNPIRAEMCKSIPESEFTSAYERIHGKPCEDSTGASKKPLMSFISTDSNLNEACLPCTQAQYFELLDWSSRVVRADKKGVISIEQPPLLQQLAFNQNQWQILCTSLGKVTHGAIGALNQVEHFHQSRGCKRRPRTDVVVQLFG
ncbi:transposase [Salinibius halmophilus]|uniref:transposase n=1 Tax=Salinibius halmophilus TaxID=1853216 RepID=UPI000E6647DB|nr:transposase [Salinibius halmophilus]